MERTRMGIAYELHGAGEPLILLHGFFGDRSTWHSAGHVERLAEKFTVIPVDLRGHGDSDAPYDPSAYTMAAQCADVLSVLDDLGLERASVWGSSMGGIIGLHLLAEAPGRVRALVANGAHGLAERSAPGEIAEEVRILRTEGVAPFLTGLDAGWLRESALAQDPRALAALSLALADRPPVSVDLPEVPALLMVGADDPLRETVRETAGALPRGRFELLPGLGHVGVFLRPGVTVPLVEGFVREVSEG
jgi:pimeloyl-ACP methyl ester carboxylesterase